MKVIIASFVLVTAFFVSSMIHNYNQRLNEQEARIEFANRIRGKVTAEAKITKTQESTHPCGMPLTKGGYCTQPVSNDKPRAICPSGSHKGN